MTWDTYTPTLTGVSGGGSLGNATVVARYIQRGKLVHAVGSITAGNTTNFGTDTMQIALPVTPAAGMGQIPLGIVRLTDASTGNLRFAMAFMSSGVLQMFYDSTHGGPLAAVDNTANQPWAWTTSDVIAWNLTYEAA